MKTENIDTMLYIRKSGISTENITGGYYKENNILLKSEHKTKTTSTVNLTYASLDEKNNTVVIKN